MEGLQHLNVLLQQRDYMCKLDLKDAYFSVLLSKYSRNIIGFNGQATFTSFSACVLA